MNNKLITIIIILLLFATYFNCGCIEEEEPEQIYEVPNFSPDQTEFTDEELLNAAYSSYKYPEGFYQEPFNGTSFYYVNTISTGLSQEKWIELCTDDKNQALEWFKLHKKNESITLNDIEETEKYFNIHGSRIHKSSYLNRSNYDKLLKNNENLGTFNQRPITEENVKELIEYLWFTNNYLFSNLGVLSSFSLNENLSILHTIFEVSLGRGDWGMCDTIQLEQLKYYVNKTTGEIIFEENEIREIQGEYQPSSMNSSMNSEELILTCGLIIIIFFIMLIIFLYLKRKKKLT